jgi:hypothetical protein
MHAHACINRKRRRNPYIDVLLNKHTHTHTHTRQRLLDMRLVDPGSPPTVTELGKRVSAYPVAIPHGAMLVQLADQHKAGSASDATLLAMCMFVAILETGTPSKLLWLPPDARKDAQAALDYSAAMYVEGVARLGAHMHARAAHLLIICAHAFARAHYPCFHSAYTHTHTHTHTQVQQVVPPRRPGSVCDAAVCDVHRGEATVCAPWQVKPRQARSS